jgi:hypothetical protein
LAAKALHHGDVPLICETVACHAIFIEKRPRRGIVDVYSNTMEDWDVLMVIQGEAVPVRLAEVPGHVVPARVLRACTLALSVLRAVRDDRKRV